MQLAALGQEGEEQQLIVREVQVSSSKAASPQTLEPLQDVVADIEGPQLGEAEIHKAWEAVIEARLSCLSSVRPSKAPPSISKM